MKFQRKEIVTVTTAFVVGVCMGMYVLSKDNPGTSQQSNFVNARFRSVLIINNTESRRENQDLITLLKTKLEDLKVEGMLRTIPSRAACSRRDLISACVDQDCPRPMVPNVSPENIWNVLKPVRKVGENTLVEARRAFNLTDTDKKYVFITGASSNHFNESQVNLESFHKHVAPHFDNYKLYYYDFGLTAEERRLVREHTKAELRTFPFDKLPPHTHSLQCYAWKPLIALAHLPHAEFTLWMDSSMSFKGDINSYFKRASKTGIVFRVNGFQMAQHTSRHMFSYFGDEPCQLSSFNEIEAGFQIWHNEEFTRRLLIEPWSACALDPDCMCPALTSQLLKCKMDIRKYGKCHRFDQSCMGYLSAKLFREHRRSVVLTEGELRHKVNQSQTGSYLFKLDQEKKSISLRQNRR